MKTDQFLETLREIIQEDAELDLCTPLESLDSWDSMAIMAIIAWFDVKHNKKVDFETLESLDTVGDIAALVPDLEK